MEEFYSNSTKTTLLWCPSCENNSGLTVVPCPCELPTCWTDNCYEVYRMCTTIFKCQPVNHSDADSVLFRSNETSSVDNSLEVDWTFLAFAVTLMLAGAVGNILVCLAVCLDRTLQNSTNYFLLSLAMADLIVSLCVMPLGAIPGFLGYWPLGVAWCSVYVTSDVLACSSSILHMCVISLGRYFGIRSPLRARRRRSKRFLAKKIACVWLVAALISSPITILGAYDAENIMPSPNSCLINNRAFLVLGSITAFYAPMLLMVGSYGLTLDLLRRKAKFGAKARAQQLLQQGRPLSSGSDSTSSRPVNNGGVVCIPLDLYKSSGCRSSRQQKSVRLRVSARSSQLRLSEHKASTVLGLVFASFVLCWTPFFILNVLIAVCPSCISSSACLFSVCLWLGYGSSTINPIIYTVFNRSFRAALFRLLRCRGAPPPARFRPSAEYRTTAVTNTSHRTRSLKSHRVTVTRCSSITTTPHSNSHATYSTTFDVQ